MYSATSRFLNKPGTDLYCPYGRPSISGDLATPQPISASSTSMNDTGPRLPLRPGREVVANRQGNWNGSPRPPVHRPQITVGQSAHKRPRTFPRVRVPNHPIVSPKTLWSTLCRSSTPTHGSIHCAHLDLKMSPACWVLIIGLISTSSPYLRPHYQLL